MDGCAPVASVRGFITGPGNFRYALATIQPYKGNRVQDKPVWYNEIKQFLVEDYDAEIVEGIEADDKLVIEFLKDPKNSIVATRDKDLAQVEWIRLYDWKKKELRTITPEQAKRNFYMQLLTGDATDNIKGVTGLGPAKAEKLLGKIKDEKLMLTACYSAYLKEYGKKAWSSLEENARLLWLLRKESDIENPQAAWKPVHKPETC